MHRLGKQAVVITFVAGLTMLQAGRVVAQEPPLLDTPIDFNASTADGRSPVTLPGPPAAAPQPLAGAVASPWNKKSLHVGLQVSFAVLQALDAASTLAATRGGNSRELNPLMAPLADRTAAFVGIKAASTLSTLFLMRQTAKRHPRAAALVAIALDSAYAMVVANNIRIASSR